MRYASLIILTALLLSNQQSDAGILYNLDPSFTQIDFNVDNLGGVFNTKGSFSKLKGELTLDLDAPQNSKVDVGLDASSVSTGWDLADEMLKSSDFLDPDTYPTIHFVSQHIDVIDPKHVTLHGQLTLRNITSPIQLDAHLQGQYEDPKLGPIADFHLEGAINRDDFGMVTDHPLVGSIINIAINAHIRLTPVSTATLP